MTTSSISKLTDTLNAVNAEMKTKGRAAFEEAFKEVFEKCPELVGVRWRQYTPGFNDGEPCEFGRHELYVRLESDTDDEAGDHEDGYDYPKGAVEKALEEIDCAPEELFEFAFGNGVEVTVTREGINIEGYDCGY